MKLKLRFILYNIIKNLKIGDVVIFILISAISIYLIFLGLSGPKGKKVEIVTPSNIYYYNLEINNTITVEGKLGQVKIEIYQGKIRMIENKSPRKLGVKMGWIDIPGLSIICLPSRVSATIISNDDNNYKFDAMVD